MTNSFTDSFLTDDCYHEWSLLVIVQMMIFSIESKKTVELPALNNVTRLRLSMVVDCLCCRDLLLSSKPQLHRLYINNIPLMEAVCECKPGCNELNKKVKDLVEWKRLCNIRNP